MSETKESLWEGRANVVVQAVVVAILIWIGNTVVDLRTELSVLKAQVAAAAANGPQVIPLLTQIKELEMRNRELERRLGQLEDRANPSNNNRQSFR